MEIRQIFLKPPVTPDYSLQWRDVDTDGVKRLLCEEHDFSPERVTVALEKMSEAARSRKQQSLDQWFG
jgi:flap endonuclease-1